MTPRRHASPFGMGSAPGSPRQTGQTLVFGRAPYAGGAAAEHLGPGGELHMDLEADHRFPGHQRTSPVASSARFERHRGREHAGFVKAAAISWPPMGNPWSRDRSAATAPATLPATRDRRRCRRDTWPPDRRSFRRRENAGVGVVGVKSKSTPLANTVAKSWMMRRRTAWARRIVLITIAGAQHKSADQDPAPDLGAEPFAARRLIERTHIALRPDAAGPYRTPSKRARLAAASAGLTM